MVNYENMSMTELVNNYVTFKDICEKLEVKVNTSRTNIKAYDAEIKKLENKINIANRKAKKDIKDIKKNYTVILGIVTKDGREQIENIENQLNIDLESYSSSIEKYDEILKDEQEDLQRLEEKIHNAKEELEKIRDEAYKFKEVQEISKTNILEKTEELNKPFEKLDNTFKEIVSNPFDNIQKKNNGYNNFRLVQDIVDKQNELFKEDDFASSYNNKTDAEKDKLKDEMVNSAIRIYEVGNKFKDNDVLNKDENAMLDKINDILGIKDKLGDIEKNNTEIEQKKVDIKDIKDKIQENQDNIEKIEAGYAAGKFPESVKNAQIKALNHQITTLETDRDTLNKDIQDLEKTNSRLKGEIEYLKKDANKKIKQTIKDELENSNVQSKLGISELYAIERKNLEDQFHEMQYRKYNELQSSEIQEDQRANVLTEDMKEDIKQNGEEAIRYIMSENKYKIDALVNEIQSQENSDMELGIKKYLSRINGVKEEDLALTKYNIYNRDYIETILKKTILDATKIKNKQDITKVKDNYVRTIQSLNNEIQKLSQVKKQPTQAQQTKAQPTQNQQNQTQPNKNQHTQSNSAPQQTQGGYGPTYSAQNPIVIPKQKRTGLLGRFLNRIKSRFKGSNQAQPTQPQPTQTQQNQTQSNQNPIPQPNQKDQDQELREMKPGELNKDIKEKIIEMFEERDKEELEKIQKDLEKKNDGPEKGR